MKIHGSTLWSGTFARKKCGSNPNPSDSAVSNTDVDEASESESGTDDEVQYQCPFCYE